MTCTDSVPAVPTDRAVNRPPVLACPQVCERVHLGLNWIHRDRFERILDALAAAGWTFLDLDHYLAALRGTEKPSRGILLSFDHAGPEFLELVAPLLLAREIPAVIFVPTASVGRVSGKGLGPLRTRHRQLGWQQLKELSRWGIRAQPVGHHYLDLRGVSLEIAYGELIRSRREIERRLGQEALALAYPYGSVDLQLTDLAARAGFLVGFGSGKWPTEAGVLNLSRVRLRATDRPATLEARLVRPVRRSQSSGD